mgnify:CR=1 FL=1
MPSVACKLVYLKAPKTNAGTVYVGKSTTTAEGTVTNTTDRTLHSLDLQDPLGESVSAFVTAARAEASTVARPEEARRALESALLIEEVALPTGEMLVQEKPRLRRTA